MFMNYRLLFDDYVGRIDVIVFTGGIGENGIDVRKDVMEKISVLGVNASEERNNVRGKLQLITEDDSKIKCYVVPTNEELMIALDTYNLIK